MLKEHGVDQHGTLLCYIQYTVHITVGIYYCTTIEHIGHWKCRALGI